MQRVAYYFGCVFRERNCGLWAVCDKTRCLAIWRLWTSDSISSTADAGISLQTWNNNLRLILKPWPGSQHDTDNHARPPLYGLYLPTAYISPALSAQMQGRSGIPSEFQLWIRHDLCNTELQEVDKLVGLWFLRDLRSRVYWGSPLSSDFRFSMPRIAIDLSLLPLLEP